MSMYFLEIKYTYVHNVDMKMVIKVSVFNSKLFFQSYALFYDLYGFLPILLQILSILIHGFGIKGQCIVQFFLEGF